jgi:hypothetical protein
MMRVAKLLFAITLFLSLGVAGQAQETPLKYEIGVQFSSLSFDSNDVVFVGRDPEFRTRTLPGLGGRFTYNLSDNISFEVESNLFLGRTSRFAPLGTGGRPYQTLFGVKLGKRLKKIGIFAKVRPGFVIFSEGKIPLSSYTDPNVSVSGLRAESVAHKAVDVGGVAEFYPSRHLVVRFDAGDTIIRYGEQSVPAPGFFPVGMLPPAIVSPAKTRHNLQVGAGVGFRF